MTPTWSRLAEIVSDSLAAATEGTDWAEAPEYSDEPGSLYVNRLTNEIASRLGQPRSYLLKVCTDPVCGNNHYHVMEQS